MEMIKSPMYLIELFGGKLVFFFFFEDAADF